MSTTSARDEALFSAALARPAAERAAFLDGACGADAALRARLDALLAAHEGTESLMAAPAVKRPEALPDLSAVALAKAEGLAKAEEKPGDRIGRYKLLQKIGEGGCGVVWMAEQEEPVRRRVALKVIKLGMDTKAVVARFEAERQALAMMDHPNIAKVHDAGATETGRPFFVMELVRGIPITKYCDENKLNPTARLELFIKVCQAVQHAHQKGIIHRDIKPSNILVTVNDGQPTPKIIDFGIAKATQGRLTDATVFTAFEQFIGTPVYMSPEQAEMSSLDIDTRSDIYSLGVLLYELLTGRPPFDPKKFAQAGVDQIRQQIREVEPPRPSTRLSTLDDDERTTIARLRNTASSDLSIILRGDLDWIVMRCIEKDRTRRYDTANGLALDIQRYLRHEPVVARPPSTTYLLQKLIRRHRVGFAAGAVVALALVSGGIVSAWQAVRATHAEREQSRLRATAEAAEAAAKQSARSAYDAEQLAGAARRSAENLLSFVFTDLGDQLGDFGQAHMLEQLAGQLLAYYEALPPALQNRETRARHALAIAGPIGISGWQVSEAVGESRFGEREARERLERALAVSRELESEGQLTAGMRLSLAGVSMAAGIQYFRESRLADSVRLYSDAIRIIEPAIADPEWGRRAQLALIKFLVFKRPSAVLGGTVEAGLAALPDLERALALASAMEFGSSPPRWPGLRPAVVKAWYAAALVTADRRDEARRMNQEARARLQELIERAPFLVTARLFLAHTARNAWRQARFEWDFDAVRAEVLREQREYETLRTHDPKNWNHRTMAARSWDTRGEIDWLEGEFPSAEDAIRQAVELWNVEWIPVGSHHLLEGGYYQRALLCAATGRDLDARRLLGESERVRARQTEKQSWLDEAAKLVRWAGEQANRREIAFQQLNWPAMRENAEQALARLGSFTAGGEASAPLQSALRTAHRDLMRAAFELRDYATARRELDAWATAINSPPSTARLQTRFDRLRNQLTWIHVRAGNGDTDGARTKLAGIWPEAEALLMAAPRYLFNQVQTARALSIRAEIDGTPEEKRAWLNRAAGYLRPAAAAGRLTRYEREILLAGIELQLAALGPPATP